MVCLSRVVMWWVGGTLAFAQGRFTDVLVSVVKDKVIAVTGVGQSEIDLTVGETVVSIKAHGLTSPTPLMIRWNTRRITRRYLCCVAVFPEGVFVSGWSPVWC
jgi:hypothetical protein